MTASSDERLLGAILTAGPDDLFLVDADDLVVAVRRAEGSALPDALVEGASVDVLPPDQALPLRRALERARRGMPAQADWVVHGATGLRVWEARVRPLGDGEALVLVREVTQRRRGEMGLAADKERLSVVLRSIQAGVVSTDREERVVMMNPAAERILGVGAHQARGRAVDALFDDVALDGKGGAAFVGEVLEVSGEGGSVRSVRVSVVPVLQHGQLLGGVYVLRDVTEELRLERERMRASKLESVGLLAGGIAHDFNNLLAAILGNVSVARHLIDDDELDEIMEDIEAGARRATGLTRQLLTFSSGGAPMTSVGAIDDVVREAVDFGMRGSKVSHRYVLPDDLPLVEFDRGQIQQVLQNLVINACQAMPEGGELVVTAAAASSAPPSAPGKAAGWVRLSVEDSGVGIAPSVQSRIFDPYFTTKSDGTGLGLAAAYAIVRKHGGTMTVDSEEGEGATFHVYLPAAAPAPSWADELASGPPPRFEGRVLVVDDEAALRGMAKRLLGILGVEPVLCDDGQAGVEAYVRALEDGERFDVVLLDLTVPGGMGGQEAIRRLLEVDPDAICVATSGYSTDPVMARYADYGFRGRLAKPYDLAELVRALRGLMPTEEGAPAR